MKLRPLMEEQLNEAAIGQLIKIRTKVSFTKEQIEDWEKKLKKNKGTIPAAQEKSINDWLVKYKTYLSGLEGFLAKAKNANSPGLKKKLKHEYELFKSVNEKTAKELKRMYWGEIGNLIKSTGLPVLAAGAIGLLGGKGLMELGILDNIQSFLLAAGIFGTTAAASYVKGVKTIFSKKEALSDVTKKAASLEQKKREGRKIAKRGGNQLKQIESDIRKDWEKRFKRG